MCKLLKTCFLFFSLLAAKSYGQAILNNGPEMPNPSEKSPLDSANFTYHMLLQGRFAFVDTSRQTAMDLQTQTARFGLRYKYGTMLGTIEAQAGTPVGDTTQQTSTTSTTPNNTNNFTVRRANINVNFVELDFVKFGFNLGRDRLNTSIMYSPDGLRLLGTNVENSSSFASHDGLGIKFIGDSDYGIFSFGGGYYNNIIVAVQNMHPSSLPFAVTTLGVADNNFGLPSSSQSRGAAAYVGADLTSLIEDSAIEFRVLYQGQAKLVTNINPSIAAPKLNNGAYTARDVSSVEASLGLNYNKDVFRVGLWGQYVTLGHSLISQGGTSNQIYYEYQPVDDTQHVGTVGFGLTGNSKPFFSDFLGLDDALIYGISGQYVTGELYSSGVGSSAPFTNSVTTFEQLNVGFGYEEAFYKLELNFLYTLADNEIYTDTSGNQNFSSHSIIYLSASLAI